jgi:hypothetical protein
MVAAAVLTQIFTYKLTTLAVLETVITLTAAATNTDPMLLQSTQQTQHTAQTMI